MLQVIGYCRALLDFVGGVRSELPTRAFSWLNSPIVWGIWWAILALLILAFSGQSSRFIYIDF